MITDDKRLRNRRKRFARKGHVGLKNCPHKPNVRTRGSLGDWPIVPGGVSALENYLPRGTNNAPRAPELTPYEQALESGDERTGRWHPAGTHIAPIECGDFNGEKIVTRTRKAREKARMSYNVAVQHGLIHEE